MPHTFHVLVAAFLSSSSTSVVVSAQRDIGILYEVWHSSAATNMNKIRTNYPTAPLLTTELVIQSAGNYTLNDVLAKYNISGDIWNVQPETGDDDGGGGGFYCLYSHRPGDPLPAPLPDCPNRTATATRHANMLSSANFTYVSVDWTNWPLADVQGSTDIAILRPTQNLFAEWTSLRQRGIPTPQISVWPCSPPGSTSWQWALDNLYNNATYTNLVYRQNGKMIMFIPYTSTCYDASVVAQIESNGGLNNVAVIPMWALFGPPTFKEGVYGFFSPCTDTNGDFTTSMVGENIGSCNQYPTFANNSAPIALPIEISASGGYMLSQCALPFASPGHLRGLTVARLFEQILETSPPHVFMSSFNEHIGGRQGPASGAKIAFNMGLPNDPQKDSVWVDSYASEFSRDIEPSVEGGNATWIVASSCVRMYMAGRKCSDADASSEPCCTREDKEIFGNIWSLGRKDGSDYLLTQLLGERNALIGSGDWIEECNPIPNPTAFCINTAERDGRKGPFMLYNTSNTSSTFTDFPTVPLYRCITTSSPANQQHFFSLDSDCESGTNGGAKMESILGYISTRPGRETLRALYRCKGTVEGTRFHALDLPCDTPDGDAGGILGYVR